MNDATDNESEETLAASPGEPTAQPASQLSFQPATTSVAVEHYQVREEIGAGGMGSVLAAADSRLERTVAMKVLRAGVEADAASRLRFEREARVLARIEHPNIVPVHEAGRTVDGLPYYTMKHVRGRTLQEILDAIRSGVDPTKLDELLTIFRKTCDAVAFAHSRGIIHRDLKPANIMVGEFGEVLVMDWGLAKVAGEPEVASTPADESKDVLGSAIEVTLEGHVLGTPQYMSPEQSAGRTGEVDARSDVYALGGILHAIITLRAPVSGTTLNEVRSRVASGERNPIPPGRSKERPHCRDGMVPEALVAVVNRAMALRADERYPAVADLAADIDAHRRGFATAAEEAGALRLAFLYLQRHKFIFLTAMIGLAAAVWTYAFSLRYLRQEQAKLGGEIRKLHQAGRAYQEQVKKLSQAENDFGSLRWRAAVENRLEHGVPAAPPGWRDLQPEILALGDDPLVARWKVGGRMLGSPTSGASVLPLPGLPLDRPYRLRLTVRKLFQAGPFVVLIPSGKDTYAPFLMDARRGSHRYFGVELKPPDAAARAFVKLSQPISFDRQYELEIAVQPPASGVLSVAATLDGETLIDWTGAATNAPPRRWHWDPDEHTRLHLGAISGNWLVSKIWFQAATE